MRMWFVDPETMCDKHLLGEHYECHVALGAIVKDTPQWRSFVRKGLILPGELQNRHDELVTEMQKRGFVHKSPMCAPEWVSRFDRFFPECADMAAHVLLFQRCTTCRERFKKVRSLDDKDVLRLLGKG